MSHSESKNASGALAREGLKGSGRSPIKKSSGDEDLLRGHEGAEGGFLDAEDLGVGGIQRKSLQHDELQLSIYVFQLHTKSGA